MKIIILTTKTDHHLFFVNNLLKKFKNIDVVIEKKISVVDYSTNHKFLKKRKKFEKKFFFNNKKNYFKNVNFFLNVNEKKCIQYIEKIKPDIIISFGVGFIKSFFLKKFKNCKIINLHGGNLNFYRGLDSHLWSIYHNDFNNLITTLHYVNKKFDTGNEIFSKKILIKKNTKFESIRALNTINCIKLVIKFLNIIKKNNRIISKKNKSIGRYYSAIPAVLINKCVKNFESHIISKKK